MKPGREPVNGDSRSANANEIPTNGVGNGTFFKQKATKRTKRDGNYEDQRMSTRRRLRWLYYLLRKETFGRRF